MHNCNINCKALERVILGMANNEWLQQRSRQRLVYSSAQLTRRIPGIESLFLFNCYTNFIKKRLQGALDYIVESRLIESFILFME